MRSMKLLIAMAVLAAFVSGPVMAQTSAPAGGDTGMSSDQGMTSSKTTTGSTAKKHKGKKHKKSSSSGAAKSTTSGQ
jgi:hypothetical protein